MNKKILLIDDNEDILDIFSIALMDYGYEVTTSNTPDNLLELITKTSPALIILDNWIGDVKGSDICRGLKTDTSFSKIPVILCSGSDNLEALSAEAKADGYLRKPFSLDDLANCVEDVMNLKDA